MPSKNCVADHTGQMRAQRHWLQIGTLWVRSTCGVQRGSSGTSCTSSCASHSPSPSHSSHCTKNWCCRTEILLRWSMTVEKQDQTPNISIKDINQTSSNIIKHETHPSVPHHQLGCSQQPHKCSESNHSSGSKCLCEGSNQFGLSTGELHARLSLQ